MLSEIAKRYGLKTEWMMFQQNSFFPDIPELEICKRVEATEERISMIEKRLKILEKRDEKRERKRKKGEKKWLESTLQ